MAGKPGMHNIGRPEKQDSQKTKFILKSFYFPFRLEDVWTEFEKITREKSETTKELGLIESQKHRTTRIILRRLILNCVNENSKNNSLKLKIKSFSEQEDKYINTLVTQWKLRKRETSSKQEIENKERFNLKTFYFPDKLKDVYQEFVNLCKKAYPRLSKIEGYKNRTVSMGIRNLILSYVLEMTDKGDIKAKINYYLKEERGRLSKISDDKN